MSRLSPNGLYGYSDQEAMSSWRKNTDCSARIVKDSFDHGTLVVWLVRSGRLPFHDGVTLVSINPSALSHEPASHQTSRIPSQISCADHVMPRTLDAFAQAIPGQLIPMDRTLREIWFRIGEGGVPYIFNLVKGLQKR